MKVLYCNPIFLDYRIPFYKKLHELFGGNFFVLYGTNKYKNRYEQCLARIQTELRGIAFGFNGDHFFNPSKLKFDEVGGNGHFIPLTFGLMRNIRKFKPDILITEGFYQWTPLIVLYSFIFRKQVYIGYERTSHTERNKGKFTILYRKMVNLFITGYLVNGSETKKYLESIGICPDKIHIGGMNADGEGLRNSIAKLTSDEIKSFKNTFNKGEGLVFLFTGYITKRKGVKHLLESWVAHIKKYPQDSLILVGGGDLLPEYQELYSNQSTIFFEGRVNYSDIYKYYAIADIYIMPTIEDNWSLVIPEAMACGKPVATSIYNGCHVELVKNDINGFTFDTFDHQTIIDVLEKFHYVDLTAFGKESIELEKPFNVENCAKRVFEVLSK